MRIVVSRERDETARMRRMVDLLRSGATMLADVCPICNSPLFKLKSGEVFCPGCEKRVIFVKEGEDVAKITQIQVISELTSTASQKLMELTNMAKFESDLDRLYEIGRCVLTWLEIFERVRKLQA
ncbi:MAG: Sjogren's syndrome/scleroderma autoantigen 1 family protein [Candidatus Nezhaarchaeales archaeon]